MNRGVIVVSEERDIGALLESELPGARWLRQADATLLEAEVAILFSTATSEAWGARLAEAGVLVIDHAARARLDPAVPTVVPQVNGHALTEHAGLIASPNCVSVMLALALAPLQRAAGLARVHVVSLQAISGAGDEVADPWLAAPTLDLEARIPQGQPLAADGWSAEERETADELRRLLEAPALRVSATCVRVPVANAHGVAVHLELERPLAADAAAALLREAPLLQLHDEAPPSPLAVSGSDRVHLGRLRRDGERGLCLWLVGDNLRRGTALNAADILRALRARAESRG